MTHRLRRAVLAACLLALLSPTLARALPWRPSEPPTGPTAATGFLDLMRSFLAVLFGENGSGLDPDGATAKGDAGPGLDPDGLTGAGDAGSGLDPSGG